MAINYIGPRINYRNDGEPNPLFWWPYRAVVKYLGGLLTEPGMRLTQSDSMRNGYFPIGLLAQSKLDWCHFDFTKGDKMERLYDLPPGKSAHIDFLRVLGLEIDDQSRQMAVDAILQRDARPVDRLYGAHICGVESTGWQVHWTPLPQNPLHVLMIPSASFGNPDFIPRKPNKQLLADTFWLM